MSFPTKQCSKCHEQKNVELFARDRSNRDGRRSSCKQCDKLNYDPEKRRAWREANREKLKTAAQMRYRKFKRKIDQQMIDYAKTPKGRASRLYTSARLRAKKYGFDFNLNPDFLYYLLTDGRCAKSHLPFDLQPRVNAMRNPFAPSVDRIDNSKGYTFHNVQVVCNMFNCGKGEADELDFIAMCVAVAERHRDNPAVIQRLSELRNAEF